MVYMDAEHDAYNEAVRVTIKVELTSRGWLYQDLAKQSGLTYTTVGRLLRGERDLTMPYLRKLAAAFGWSAGELLIKAEERLREHGHDVPGDPGIHPEDERLIDESAKLTKRQRSELKATLKGGSASDHRLSDRSNPGESIDSSARRRGRAGAG
jgi:transcriptional regulator with XRE-family HTH domain